LALYLHATPEQREAIRKKLAPILRASGKSPVLARASEDDIGFLVNAAAHGDIEGFAERVADLLGVSRGFCWRFYMDESGELLCFALMAAHVPTESIIRIFLTLDPVTACSVTSVFHLSHVARTVPKDMAARLVEAVLGLKLQERSNAARYVPFEENTPRVSSMMSGAALIPATDRGLFEDAVRA
jgi:hypothetical protein